MSRLARPAARLSTGSAIVARRLGNRAAAWCARGRRADLAGWRAILGIIVRLVLLLFGLYLLARVVRALPALMWLISSWWTVAAWRAGKTTAPVVEPPAEEPATTSPQEVLDGTVEWIWQQVGDRQGVHLRDLLAHAQAHGMFEDLEVSSLRGHLERWGIPVRDRQRVRGLGVTVGISRADLESFCNTSPTAAPRGAA